MGDERTVGLIFPDLHVRAVDAVGSAVFGYPFSPYKMRGIGLSWTPGNLRAECADSLHRVTDTEALSLCRVLAAEEGILLGESGGAAVFAALTYATAHPGKPVLAVAPDSGANHLYESYDDEWLREHGIPPEVLSLTPGDVLRHSRLPVHAPTSLPRAARDAPVSVRTIANT